VGVVDGVLPMLAPTPPMQRERRRPRGKGLRSLIVAAFVAGLVARTEAADTSLSSTASAALATPTPAHIPATQLRPAVEQAVANGVGTLMARILASGNDTGLAFPPRITRKIIGVKKVPARRIQVEEPVYEHEYATVDAVVPELSAGQPTGRFVKGKRSVVVKTKKVGTKTVDRLVYDPAGSDQMDTNVLGPGGPDVYEVNWFGLNGMAVYVLARSGHGQHPATVKCAEALARRVEEFGISDHTFDVAWMAAGFTSLGKDSKHAKLAADLVSRLIDGQIREKGDPRGLWGPVCVHSSYYAKLFEIQEGVRRQLEVELPKMIEAAAPQQQAALLKQGKEMRRVNADFQRAFRNASSQGTRMLEVTQPYRFGEHSLLAGLSHYFYNHAVADIESTAVATFALAEAKRAGVLPAETLRASIRGKRVHPAEKTAAGLKLAAEKLGGAIGADGGFTSLTLQAVNTGFDKSKVPIPGVPYKGDFPPLLLLETAVTCVSGQSAMEFLARTSPDVMEDFQEQRDRARTRARAIAERWYRESSKGFKPRWRSVYQSLSVVKSELSNSPPLTFPPVVARSVDELPWGTEAAAYEVALGFVGLFASDSGAALFDDGLYRQIAYRLVGLQDANGQWTDSSMSLFSSAKDALVFNAVALNWHRAVVDRGLVLDIAEKVPYTDVLQRAPFGNLPVIDAGGYPTLASLVVLLQSIDEPVSLAGVTLAPEAEPATGAEPDAAAPPPSLTAVRGADRPNAALSALYDAVLDSLQPRPADPPAAAAKPPAAKAEPAPAESGQPEEDLGKVEDLLETSP
jgi:hypothetical protein